MPIEDKLYGTSLKRVFAFTFDMFTKNIDVGRLVHSASLVEIDERHKVGREIHILQKEQ